MKKYNCEYCNSVRLNIGDKWQMKIEAANPKEAYEKFIEKVGRYPEEVIVDIWWGLHSEIFDDHIEASKQRIHEKGKSEGDQRESQATNELEDLEIEYQESGWAGFLNVCGCLNLILFMFGVIWLFNARSSDQFMAMNLTIIGLVAGINSFFFAFLVNTFTRIQHNTHLTTLELIKLNKKNDSDN